LEVLTRGPVEAFAETVTFDPEPGVVVAKAAPDAIEELELIILIDEPLATGVPTCADWT
jgi:hypothetical protein